MRQKDTERDRTQKDTERHRMRQEDTERDRKTQKETERHRKRQKDTEKDRMGQEDTGHRKRQKDTERVRDKGSKRHNDVFILNSHTTFSFGLFSLILMHTHERKTAKLHLFDAMPTLLYRCSEKTGGLLLTSSTVTISVCVDDNGGVPPSVAVMVRA